MVILVTGAHGQLGQALQSVALHYPAIQFRFCGSQEADLTNKISLKEAFKKHKPTFCINAAAYTAVDKAESEPEKAYAINAEGVRNLAEVCLKNQTVLLHVSTDFVFDGLKKTPYTETDIPNPTGVYGASKLAGEQAVQDVLTRFYIVRTAWVYSRFGANFMKTMLRLGSEREQLTVVDDQLGSPTLATDLANTLVHICQQTAQNLAQAPYGIYHYANEGSCSWCGFAKQILLHHHINTPVIPIPTSSFPTPAKRPAYSVLDKSKIKQAFGLEIVSWQVALQTLD
ncbi:MAG: dTDP-4-dehydrorhamnose reductase [Flavobacterium sp.]|nr:dTDP-4-dehydrorhamnose reductase [Flavobacterium sp.]